MDSKAQLESAEDDVGMGNGAVWALKSQLGCVASALWDGLMSEEC